MNDTSADVFESHRHHLFGVAYRMLGSVGEAEDAVQETWFRWAAADQASIRSPKGWLTTVVSRLSVDRLRSAQKRREAYVGPWLPEPLVDAGDDPAELTVLADTLSLAFLELLERLNTELGKTMIIVTHDPTTTHYAKETLHLEKGRLVTEAPPALAADVKGGTLDA